MTTLLLLALLAPLCAALAVATAGWRPATAITGVASGLAITVAGALICRQATSPHYSGGQLLRADALAGVLLMLIGIVSTLAAWASISYLRDELAGGHTTPARARLYGTLINAFVTTMVLAVLANNLGVVWVAIEATTVSTAFLVGHHRTRASLEATWKYVVICSLGITLAFLGTVLLYFASLHAGPGVHALDFNVLAARAPRLDPGVTRLAAGLLLLGFGTKVGLVPFHSWLADAHSQAPAPVSALMSGVLLSVALSVLLRVKAIVDLALGPGYERAALLTVGLLTLLVAAGMLVGQRDVKRLLAYSSLEVMGLLAVAAAAGTRLAATGILLVVLAHGLTKSVLFIGAGHLQRAHASTTITDIRGVLARSPLLGGLLIAAFIALLGLPPFALFPGEVGIARGLADAHLGWALGFALLLLLIGFSSLLRHGSRLLLGPAPDNAPELTPTPGTIGPLLTGLTVCLTLGVTAGPLAAVLTRAGGLLTGVS
jgi:hydrogenase-4 component F